MSPATVTRVTPTTRRWQSRSPPPIRRRATNRPRSPSTTAHVVIAAITSCTNTSNPSVMVGAGLLARNALARGLQTQAVGQDLARARLEGRHRIPRRGRPDRAARAARLQPRRLRLHDLHRQLRAAAGGGLAGGRRAPTSRSSSVLSGNRNFEGRINPDVKMNYLASPPLCVAYALAGTMDIDLVGDPLGQDEQGQAVYLRDIWPSEREVAETIGRRSSRTCSARATPRCSPATSAGTRSRCPPAIASPGTSPRPTCACRRSSRTCRPSRRRCRTSRARACSRCSATASRPTTSPRPARSSATGPRALPAGAGRRRRATSTPTARAAATTR